ncbi:unnamed protein product [Medioppia subpectinata]|uniref:C2H2-type domain-containing protein n=1 Tax=Medioppia subpectinata TaxID=1979941 RepID=A0A7R9KZW3_9ACAR|nr:unnamed protein product [Medioppia subpectinata]CAG2113007.1 unnamed protein product [Medioppia subpectinata]
MSSLEALSVDNKRLKSELQYYCKCIELYENYRKCLLYFDNNCICLQNKDFYFVIQSLENQYKTSLRPDHQFEYQLSPKHSSLTTQSSLGTTPTASAVDNESSFVAQNLFNDFMCKTEESTDYSEDDSEDDDEDNEDEESSDGECLLDNSQVWPLIATTTTTVANTRAPKRRTGRQSRTRRGAKSGTTCTAATGRKPKLHACDWIGCGKTFRDNLALTAHVRLRHTNERPFACDKCPKSFADKKHLTQHLKYHSSQERYKCKYTDCPFDCKSRPIALWYSPPPEGS